MSKRLSLILISAAMFVGLLNNSTQAQTLGSHYFWAHRIVASTTPLDSVFALPWEYATVYADSGDVWVKIGAPDTASWASRTYIKLREGSSLEFYPFIKLRRIEFYTNSTNAVFYIVGFKRKPQY